MKAKSIVFLSLNAAATILGFIFSFTNIFLEVTEVKYSITYGQSLFSLEPNVWVVLSIIVLFCTLLVAIAALTMYTFMKIKGKKVFWKWYLALAIALCVFLAMFVIFAGHVCISKSAFGFGVSSDFKFNVACYIFIILIGGVGVCNLYNALDTNKKLLK